MKIIITALMDMSVYNGFTGLIDYQASVLRQAGHDVTVVGMSSNPPVLTAPVHWVRGSGPRAQALAARAVVRYAYRHKPDVVLLTQAGAPLVPLIVGALRARSIPVIYDCMDPVVETIRSGIGPGLLFAVLKPWLIASHFIIDRSVAVTLSVSPGLDGILRRRGWRGEILRFYNVHGTRVVGRRSQHGIRERDGWAGATILVYAGGLQAGFRGIEDQIRAAAIARRRGADVRMLLVGYGDARPFGALASECGFSELRIMPDIAPTELADVLSDCDLAVSNSLPYALPSKIFEYINNGVHVISVDDGNDVNELCADFVELYDGSIDGMASALVKLAATRHDREGVEKARQFLAGLRSESENSLFTAISLARPVYFRNV